MVGGLPFTWPISPSSKPVPPALGGDGKDRKSARKHPAWIAAGSLGHCQQLAQSTNVYSPFTDGETEAQRPSTSFSLRIRVGPCPVLNAHTFETHHLRALVP